MRKHSKIHQSKRKMEGSRKDIAEIHFYRANEKPYGALSNLYKRPINFDGREYPTAEHAYQAGKPRKEAVREWILSAPTPSLLAMAAHGLYTWDIAPDWSQTKFDRMRRVLREKFTQHQDLRELLLSTGDARLVETGRTDNEVNRVWGEIGGKGLNMLGVLLMELRSDLRQRGERVTKKGSNKSPRDTRLTKSKSLSTVAQSPAKNGSTQQSLQRRAPKTCEYL